MDSQAITLPETSNRITYSPSTAWSIVENEKYRDGQIMMTSEIGAYAELKFYGTGIEYIGSRGWDHSFLTIDLDGKLLQRDGGCCEEGQGIHQNSFLVEEGLDITLEHTIRITNTSPGPFGSFIDVDTFIIHNNPPVSSTTTTSDITTSSTTSDITTSSTTSDLPSTTGNPSTSRTADDPARITSNPATGGTTSDLASSTSNLDSTAGDLASSTSDLASSTGAPSSSPSAIDIVSGSGSELNRAAFIGGAVGAAFLLSIMTVLFVFLRRRARRRRQDDSCSVVKPRTQEQSQEISPFRSFRVHSVDFQDTPATASPPPYDSLDSSNSMTELIRPESSSFPSQARYTKFRA
ncbi:hypothetical protein BDV98DRAFT_575370 [Pterulicium gracile]|uniref:Uncharacterized protein n=1 Tax=Pterulicium gracile TaxID=1884261 RepID=A0A5C3Q461_9AGAR|nr:hypothetical protein BDV98DRAFT_575370 [Pterula gracilis]